jgi:5-methylcytosine-specific restriction enzyme A
MPLNLAPGEIYRRKALHDLYGGQRQGGISTPSKHGVIFLFTGPSGTQHGYRDFWTDDDLFHYTGEGQSGDMGLVRGNRAIYEHEKNGKSLLLFEKVSKGHVGYLGEMRYVEHYFSDGRDTEGHSRRLIVFVLEPVDPTVTLEACRRLRAE